MGGHIEVEGSDLLDGGRASNGIDWSWRSFDNNEVSWGEWRNESILD